MVHEYLSRAGVETSLRPAAVVFLLGLLADALDQALFVRAGPLPLLVTAPLVGTLVYVRFRPASTHRLLGLLAWGFAGSGVAGLVVSLRVLGYVRPRQMTGVEMVLYDLAMFLWFVLGLALAYWLAARREGRGGVVYVGLAPVVQASFALVLMVLVETGLYA